MTALDTAGLTVVWAGAVTIVVMSTGVALTPTLFRRLHLASATTTPGCLLVCLGLALTAETWHEAAKLIVIGSLLLAGSSLGTSVVARAHEAPRRGTRERP